MIHFAGFWNRLLIKAVWQWTNNVRILHKVDIQIEENITLNTCLLLQGINKEAKTLSGRGLYFMRMKIIWFNWRVYCCTYGFQSNISQLFIDIDYLFSFRMTLCRLKVTQAVVSLEMCVISLHRSMLWGGRPNNQKTISGLLKSRTVSKRLLKIVTNFRFQFFFSFQLLVKWILFCQKVSYF